MCEFLIFAYIFAFTVKENEVKVKSMQRSGTEAITTQIQPSKQKCEITNMTYSQNTKRTYGQPSEQLHVFPKRWPLSNRNRTKNNMNTHKVKRHRNSDAKTGNGDPQENYRLGTLSRLIHVLRRQPRPQFLKWYKTFSWLSGSYDKPLTCKCIITVNKRSDKLFFIPFIPTFYSP